MRGAAGKKFLLLQLREGDVEADDEYQAICRYADFTAHDVHRVRMEQGETLPTDVGQYKGVLVGGGPWNVSDTQEKKSEVQRSAEQQLQQLLRDVVAQDLPYLGMCYGLGALAQQQGGVVSKERYGEEAGPVTITLSEEGVRDPLLAGVTPSFRAFCGHKEACQLVPPGAVLLASSDACPFQMVRVKRNVYAVQFHTELDAAGLAVRVDVYKHHGYFDPARAEELKAMARAEVVTEPMKILAAFAGRYR